MLKHIEISLFSKRKKSLKKFLKFFLLKTRKINSCIINKKFQKTYKKKVLSILKSPHVHKTAQEQFEYRVHFNHLKINTLKNSKFVILLKKIKNSLFSDVNIKTKFILINKQTNSLFDPKLTTLNNKRQLLLSKKQTLYFIKNVEICSEYILRFG